MGKMGQHYEEIKEDKNWDDADKYYEDYLDQLNELDEEVIRDKNTKKEIK